MSDTSGILVWNTRDPLRALSPDHFFDVMDLAIEMDLLVYTPEEFRSLTDKPAPGFWSSVVGSMKRVV
jgi:hypothetical protein